MSTSFTLISALISASSPMVSVPPSDSMVPSSRPCNCNSPEKASAPLNSQSAVKTVVLRFPTDDPGREGSEGRMGRLLGSVNVDIGGDYVYFTGAGRSSKPLFQ